MDRGDFEGGNGSRSRASEEAPKSGAGVEQTGPERQESSDGSGGPAARSAGRVPTSSELPGVPGSDRRIRGELGKVVRDEAASALVELGRAHRRLRRAGAVVDAVAVEEGWPVPFSPLRCLLLAHLGTGPPVGLTPSHLARDLAVSPSTLAHHLDVLEGAGLIERRRRGIQDRRKVRVRATERGRYALFRLASALAVEVAALAPPAPRLRRREGSARAVSRPPSR